MLRELLLVLGYIANADKFAEKGVKGIYIVSMKDIDSTSEFTKALCQDFDASSLLRNVRPKRYVAVVENGVVKHMQVEDAAPNIIVTAADNILNSL
ncbi:hypothetical protein RUND412_006422 [Rhizina undulata]